ncbi:MAG: ATP-binding cassette domain-containing protein [Deltaproteobacteria bacterium]|nr:ATP-binding cassette domain-containing protein [Deltaproteobacteria bacterium]
MIKFQDISKTFKLHQKEPGLKGSFKSLFFRKWILKHALKKVSAEIKAGEIVGLVGANGAGKTTLVKILAGIIHPTSGSANILDYTPWNRHTEFRKQIALIMGQKAQLWWDLPAADCFLLLKEIYRIPKTKFNNTLDYLVSTLQVKDQLKFQIRRLSLGERMKMELIAALLHEPKIVFLDEPTIGLDLTSQNAIRRFILDYRKAHKPAMILTSHYMEDIEKLCRRIIIIRNGEFVYDGQLSKILSEHSQYKILTAKLASELPNTQQSTKFLSTFGEVIPSEIHILKVKVPRRKIPEAASEILKNFPVIDMNIEEEEIGVIIEKLQQQGLT